MTNRTSDGGVRRLLVAWGMSWLALFTSPAGVAADLSAVGPFLTEHCHACHADGTTEGGLDLKRLGAELADAALFAKWERIHDRVAAGEMPPRSADAPQESARKAFLTALGRELSAAHAASKGTVLRRLNRQEYENTLNDLFGTHLSLVERLPADGRADEFDNVGTALGLSLVQLQRYLECSSDVLDAAIARTVERPASQVVRASYADTRGAEQWLGKIWLQRDGGAVVFFKAFGYPSGMLREANVQQDGWYQVRVTGYAHQSETPITAAIGATTFQQGAEQPTFGYFAFPPGAPTTIELRTWIPARYMIEVTPYGITDRDNQIQREGVAGYDGPGLAIVSVEVEGPLHEEFPSRGHRLLFDGLDRHELIPRNPRDRERPWYKPKFEIASEHPDEDAARTLARVASSAFRRPARPEQVEPFVSLFRGEREQGASLEEALRTAVTAIFCSPDFLYLREPSGWLDDYALATRLAYFLTRTTPDEALLAAAATGTLANDRELLLSHVDRLLADPRSERFIIDFTDAWLHLRDIEFTTPDETLYPEFDPFLQFSMLAETRSYVRRLLDENLDVSHLVRSDFAMLNSRLAEHYGIAGVEGPEIRSVTLPAESVRGGLLSQASVLKVSANGTNTSPVVRGVWVMQAILGETPPPPPAGVPGVEPDIRGASTLRELLDKHRTLDSCRGCHVRIDPPGFALESFDPIGGWRERFRSLGSGDRVDTQVRGRRVQYRLGPPVDAAGELPDGRPFTGFQEFRELLAPRRDQLARALATKLLVFATGRELGFSDRAELDKLVQQSAAQGYGVRDLVRLVVASPVFRSK